MKPVKDKFILLFSPQPVESGRRVVPMGLLAISTLLEKEGYDIRIFHSYDKDDYLEALAHLDQAICVGISSMTGYQIYDGLKFAKLVREKNSKVLIVWGGKHPTIKPIQTIKNDLVDIVVKGAGEDTFTELVRRLDKGESYEDVPGILFKKEGEIIDNQPRPVKPINSYPALPYHILGDNIKDYIKSNQYAKRNLAYITSEGCPFHCAFCYLATPYFSQKWDPYPAKRVVNEVAGLVKKFGLDGIDIRDANFFVDMQRVRDICRGFIARGIKISISGANGRAEQMIRCRDEDWQLFAQAGLKEILIGAESGDQEMLDLINKQSPVEATIECERKAKKYGINIINSFITSFPPKIDDKKSIKKQLKKELNKTVELIGKIFEVNPIANILLFFYTPYPGTPLYELSLKRGFNDPPKLEDWSFIDLAHQITPWTSKKHIRKVMLLRKLFVLKKISSPEYLKSKKGRKYSLFKNSGLFQLLNCWVTKRLKYKFYFFPFERILFPLIKFI